MSNLIDRNNQFLIASPNIQGLQSGQRLSQSQQVSSKISTGSELNPKTLNDNMNAMKGFFTDATFSQVTDEKKETEASGSKNMEGQVEDGSINKASQSHSEPIELSADVLNGTKSKAYDEQIKKDDPIMNMTKAELEQSPEALKHVITDAKMTSMAFHKELEQAMAEEGIQATIQTGDKAPAKILEKLERKSLDKGREYKLGDLSDISRGRINVDSLDDVQSAGEKVKSLYGDRILEWDDTIENPRSDGYTGRIHAVVKGENGSKFELQIGTGDITDFLERESSINDNTTSNLHDMIYKGLGKNDTELKKEYKDLFSQIVDTNRQGMRVEDNPVVSDRLQGLRDKVVDLYRNTPEHQWPEGSYRTK